MNAIIFLACLVLGLTAFASAGEMAVINPPVQRFPAGTTAYLDGSASFAKTYSWSVDDPTLPVHSVDPYEISFTIPTPKPKGPWKIIVGLTAGFADGGASSAQAIVYNDVPPVIALSAPASVPADHGVTIDATRSYDPDEEDVTYKLTQLSGPAVTVTQAVLQGALIGKFTFTAPTIKYAAAMSFQLDVADATYVTSKIVDVVIVPPSGVVSTINTYAGGGAYLNSPPLTASVEPDGVVIGPDGAVYLTDGMQINYTGAAVLRVDPASGDVTRIVGNGVVGYSGDGGPALGASLSGPQSLAFDPSGNLWIADSGNSAVRKVTADPKFDPNNPTALVGGPISKTSVISTVSKTVHNPNALVLDRTHKYFFVSTGYTGDSTAYIPKIIAALNIATGATTTIAGGCTLPCDVPREGLGSNAVLINPQAIAVDSANHLYIANGENAGPLTIMRVQSPAPAVAGTLHLVTDTTATATYSCSAASLAGNLYLPMVGGMGFDPRGDLLVTDDYQNVVCKIALDSNAQISQGSKVSLLAGGGSPAEPPYHGAPGYGDGGPATAASLNGPRGITADSTGNIYIADSGYSMLRKIDTSGIISTIAGIGPIYFGGDGNPAASSSIEDPYGVAVDTQGNVFIAQTETIRRVDHLTHVITTVAGNLGVNLPAYGCKSTTPSNANGTFAVCTHIYPTSIAVDSADNLYFVDNNTIRRVDTKGIFSTVAGTGVQGVSGDGGKAISATFNQPEGIAVDHAGNLFISDTGNSRIRRIDPKGIITTVVGNGTVEPVCPENGPCFGDGGPASGAELNQAHGIVVDPKEICILLTPQRSPFATWRSTRLAAEWSLAASSVPCIGVTVLGLGTSARRTAPHF